MAECSRIRHIIVADLEPFQKPCVKNLLKQAHQLTFDALEKKIQIIIGQSIVKSISAKKKARLRL